MSALQVTPTNPESSQGGSTDLSEVEEEVVVSMTSSPASASAAASVRLLSSKRSSSHRPTYRVSSRQ